MVERDSVIFGILLGVIVPVLGFVVVEFIFELLTSMGWMAEVSASTAERRFRTLVLIGICWNLIPFNIAKNRRWDQTMRGIVFPTLIYVAAWVYKFGAGLIG
jgi:hypothetical protein